MSLLSLGNEGGGGGGSRVPVHSENIKGDISSRARVVRRLSHHEADSTGGRRSEGGGQGMGREEKCDTEGPVALSDVRNSIKRVKSRMYCGSFQVQKLGKLARREDPKVLTVAS